MIYHTGIQTAYGGTDKGVRGARNGNRLSRGGMEIVTGICTVVKNHRGDSDTGRINRPVQGGPAGSDAVGRLRGGGRSEGGKSHTRAVGRQRGRPTRSLSE